MQNHTFHIPVMGTGFTIDTPFKVTRYGISSVVSLGDDKLIEKMREFYCTTHRVPYTLIPESEKDHRAMRITQYLNLMNEVVQKELDSIKQGSLLDREAQTYFDLLPDHSQAKKKYAEWLAMKNSNEKLALETWLRSQITAGSIDVNIMTKADRENSQGGEKLPREYSDAMASLRGFAQSDLQSAVVFSAGLNLHLYSYLAEFDDFYADSEGNFKKKVILKVSDFRSAAVQAKILAKRGIWISEYRIESGLNCGGHAFATDGYLMGPILEEFKQKKSELIASLFPIYSAALVEKKRAVPSSPHPVRITAQGGVGTNAEHDFLLRHYEVDSVGWGSPFLLVPEATAVDAEMLNKLAEAQEEDIFLSHASPLGVRFYNLKNSASEELRKKRIESGKPGSPCYSRYLAFNTEYGAPLCVASSQYQQQKIKDLASQDLNEAERCHQIDRVLEKSCICRDLGNGALIKHGIKDGKKETAAAICPGPNLAYFSKISSLREMVGHIYGRTNVISAAVSRPHFLINELNLYVRYWKEALTECSPKQAQKENKYHLEFKENLLKGIEYYRQLALDFAEEGPTAIQAFLSGLDAAEHEIWLAQAPLVEANCDYGQYI